MMVVVTLLHNVEVMITPMWVTLTNKFIVKITTKKSSNLNHSIYGLL